MVTPQNDKAVEFLELVYPAGPWALTSISPDRKSIDTQTFMPDQKKGLDNWLKKYNGERNIYWHVNPPMQAITKKAEREDIKEVCYLHVDIDPRAGEDIDEERKRALGLLQHPKKGVPHPTCITFSGGGYQAFWKLREPIPINGDLGRAEDAKRYNIQLELIFGGDNCHNIDRLMRLPGTVNIPDARKKKKGRVEELARLEEWNPRRIYDLSEFVAAQLGNDAGNGFGGGSNKEAPKVAPGNVRRLTDVEELNEWNVTDRVKVLIVQGRVPDEKKAGDDSRSAWLFDCICQLVRCEVPDEVIYSVVTDPDFKISESVIDKGAKAERYALRQIERAKEEAINPHLRKLNEKFAVIGNMGGRCRIIEEVFDTGLQRPRLTKQTFEDFRNRFMNIMIEVGKKDGEIVRQPLGKWWLGHSRRRQFETMAFTPGGDTEGVYNLWKGFAVEPRPGNCTLFLEHLKKNICNDNGGHYDYLVKWLARTVQHPDSPGEVAVVLRGDQGVGKSFFAKQFGSLFGRHFLQVADPKHLVGSFNAHLRDCVVLFGDEAFYAGDKKHESVLKMLITEEVIPIEGKGIDVEVSPNFAHVILASNSQWVVPAGKDERRFFVLDVGNSAKQNAPYFKKIKDQLDDGGREALLFHLQHLDLEGFQVRDVPKTQALYEQKIMSLSPEEEWWYRKLVEGRMLNHEDVWNGQATKRQIFVDYVRYMQEAQIMARRCNETVLGQFLRRVCPRLTSKQIAVRMDEPNSDGTSRRVLRRVYHYIFPDLNECRKSWDVHYGAENWSDPSDVEERPEPEAKPTPF